MWHWHGDGWSGGWGAGDWIGMALMMLLMWAPVLLLGIVLLRALVGPGGQRAAPPRQDAAKAEARRAYARGEIDRARFQQVMADLDEHPPAPR